MDFQKQLAWGQVGESLIASWLRKRDWYVLPVYDVELDHRKGPRLFTPRKNLIAPDMFVFKPNAAYWVEAKHKTAWTWHRNTATWNTGIDLTHYLDYCRVEDGTPWHVLLLFLQQGGQAKDSPSDSPAGLYGNRLSYLRRHEHHRHMNWGRSGMVYWTPNHFRKLANIAEISG